jgi:hypothetical protein
MLQQAFEQQIADPGTLFRANQGRRESIYFLRACQASRMGLAT